MQATLFTADRTGLRRFAAGRLAAAIRHPAFAVVLAADLACVVLFVLRAFAIRHDWAAPVLAGDLFGIDLENSLAERFQHAKIAMTAGLLAVAGVRFGAPVFVALAAAFAYAAADDALQWHERAGRLVAERLALDRQFGGLDEDIGGLLFLVSVGACLLGGLALAAVRSRPEHRLEALVFAVPIALFAAAAGVFDLVHVVGEHWFAGSNTALIVLEDGGEMVAMTFALGLALVTVGTGSRRVDRGAEAPPRGVLRRR